MSPGAPGDPFRIRVRSMGRGLEAALGWGCVGAAAALTALLLWTAAHRLRYPFELEWMEGAMVDHVARVLAVNAMYVAPSVDFVPFIYNPFYYFVSAAFALVFGLDFFALRLVSLLATLGTLAVLYAIVHGETGAKLPALVTAGTYAGTYALCGGWFDVARVDALAVLLGFAAFATACRARSRRALWVSAALGTLAFATKQPAGAYLAGIWLSLLLGRPQGALEFARATIVGLGLCLVVFARGTDGWYFFYAFSMPAGFATQPDVYTDFWTEELLGQVPVLVALGALYSLAAGRRGSPDSRPLVLPFALSAIAISWIVRPHEGSFFNDSMHAYAGLSLLAGFALHTLLALRGDAQWPSILGRAALFVQLASLASSPGKWIPTGANEHAGERLLALVRSYAGPVFLFHNGHLARKVGKPSHAHAQAVVDILRTRSGARRARDALNASFDQALAARRFDAIVTDGGPIMTASIERFYGAVPQPFLSEAEALTPKSGAPIRPRVLYEPRPK